MSTKYWIFKMYGIYAKMRERERERWATRQCICIFVKIVFYYNFTYIRHLLTFSCLRVLYRNSTVKIIKCCFDDQQFKVKTIKSPSLEIQRLHRVRIICSCLTMPAQDPTCRRPYFLHPLAVLPCIIYPSHSRKNTHCIPKHKTCHQKMCTYYTYNVKIKYIKSGDGI